MLLKKIVHSKNLNVFEMQLFFYLHQNLKFLTLQGLEPTPKKHIDNSNYCVFEMIFQR